MHWTWSLVVAALGCAPGLAQVELSELNRALPADGTPTLDLVAADFDGDGAVDLFLANDGQDRLYRNLGKAELADETARASTCPGHRATARYPAPQPRRWRSTASSSAPSRP